MPFKPKSACTQPGCRALSDGGKCELHAKARKQELDRNRVRPASHAMYHTVRWKRLRAVVLDAQPYCTIGTACDPYNTGRRAPSTVADHILSIESRPDLAWDFDNLRGCCAGCHAQKTNAEDQGGFGHKEQ